MFRHYIKIAFRNLWKYKYQNMIGITGLAVGFACFVLTGYLIENLLGNNNGIPNAFNIYELRYEQAMSKEEIRSLHPEIENVVPIPGVGLHPSTEFNIDSKRVSFYTDLLFVDTSYVDFFSWDFLYGNGESVKRTTDGSSVVFFESALKKRNIDPKDIFGKELQTKNDGNYVVTGIIKDFPGNDKYDNSWGFIVSPLQDAYNSLYYVTFYNNDTETFRQKEKSYSETTENKLIGFSPLAVRWYEDEKERRIVLIFILLGSLILISALFNYVSFHVSLFLNRLKECAMRKVNGGSRTHVFFLFYTEIAIGFLLACTLSVVIISPLLELFNTWMTRDFFVMEEFVSLIFSYGLVGLLFAAVLCLFPTAIISRSDIRTIVFGLNTTGGNMKGRNVLLFFQLFILMFFLYASFFLRFMNENLRVDFDRSSDIYNQALILESETRDSQVANNLLRELNEHTQIQSAFLSNAIFFDGYYQSDITINDSIGARLFAYHVSSGIFDFFDMDLLEGDWKDFEEEGNAIVNKAFANLYMENSEVLGSIINCKGKYYRIIGVVDNSPFVDMKQQNNSTNASPTVYFPLHEEFHRFIYVLPHSSNANTIRTTLSDIIRPHIPEENGYTTTSVKVVMDNEFDALTRLLNGAILLFIVSLIIGLLSIYSAIAMNTEKRRREVAIRKINGATIKDIITLFGKKYFILWTVVWLIGCPLVFAIRPIMEKEISLGIQTYIFSMLMVYLFVLALIILTIIFQILKVARLNPADVIKSE